MHHTEKFNIISFKLRMDSFKSYCLQKKLNPENNSESTRNLLYNEQTRFKKKSYVPSSSWVTAHYDIRCSGLVEP